MDLRWRKLRRYLLRNSAPLVCLAVPIFCLFYLLNLSLPEVSVNNRVAVSKTLMRAKTIEESGIGKLGNMMVEMLPDDLAFTVFVPSEEAFERSLNLRGNDSLTDDMINNTYAVVSRVMGFSTVPRVVHSGAVPLDREITLDSISGFRLHIGRDYSGRLVVNGLTSESVDIRKGEIVVHKMMGVLMDAEFEQSFSPDYED